MHRDFLQYLVDPETHESLSLQIDEASGDVIETGFLISSKNRYPIRRGVPRFVDASGYTASFDYQWQRWARLQFESENIGKPMEGHTRSMWDRIVGFSERGLELAGNTVLDIGCGSGRFIEIARSKGARVIGIDYSLASDVAASNFRHDPENVCIVQADALKIPIGCGVMDGSYSIGVLHHTPSPVVGVKEAFRCLRSGGWFAISVYGKGGYYDFPPVQVWRRVFNRLQPWFGLYPPLVYTYVVVNLLRPLARRVPLLGKAVRLLFPFANLPDKNWSLLDTFDSLTPTYQSAHTSYEVFSWLKATGFREIWPSNWGFTAYSAMKP